ncbi:MAG TPA: oxidoreductase family protein, partial [Macromonas sp.]|nr:oxidoreductase family protein [Macromonas sp.]
TPAMRDRETLARSIRQLWAQDDAGPLAISHGDPHVGNTYTVPGGQRRFLDWQTVCLAPWSDDVTYFMTGALTVADRRAHDAALLKHYLGALRAAIGSAAPTFDEAWLAYRQHQLHGLMFALCPSDMQPAAVCEQMGVRYGAAVTDLETLAAFGR